ncbi:hypothetical protein IWQ60_003016 [Tieghemiomyces parasiticus]|uniref:RCC1-like domain-containing protein n=1 Tax=Tieghemiomyces parasiticus TaxID=78921 RepID=A0A9W8AB64_9FUNG|nr:hypothetical protein IWQ60_003016 [Tieghemiomyces parasiticus]
MSAANRGTKRKSAAPETGVESKRTKAETGAKAKATAPSKTKAKAVAAALLAAASPVRRHTSQNLGRRNAPGARTAPVPYKAKALAKPVAQPKSVVKGLNGKAEGKKAVLSTTAAVATAKAAKSKASAKNGKGKPKAPETTEVQSDQEPAISSPTEPATTAVVEAAKGLSLSDAADAGTPTNHGKAPSRGGRKATNTGTSAAAATKTTSADLKATSSAKSSSLKRSAAASASGGEKGHSTHKVRIHTKPVRPTAAGTVLVFGNGDCGQLGLGDDIMSRKKPYPVAPLNDESIVDIAAGGLHNMAITADGRLFSWGCNDQHALGREGDETEPGEVTLMAEDGTTPVRFLRVACGDSVTVALTTHGVYSWGTYRSSDGLLGFDQTKDIQKTPALVDGLQHEDIIDISVGADHVLALTTHGEVYGWGDGQQHQLGRRIIERRKRNGLRPTKLGLKHITQIGTGAYHSFAVNTEGQLFAWGLNNFHQCGVEADEPGTDESAIYRPTVVPELDGIAIAQVCGGEHHSIVLTTEGRLYGFGRSDSHQLGLPFTTLPEDVAAHQAAREAARERALAEGRPFDETTFASHKKAISRPTLLPSEEGCPPFAKIAIGSNHNIALTADGEVYSWGFGEMLALGNGEDTDVPAPTLVEGKRLEDAKVVAIAAGGQHSVLLSQPRD